MAEEETPAQAPRRVRKTREGLVVSDKMQATVVVAVTERVRLCTSIYIAPLRPACVKLKMPRTTKPRWLTDE